MKYEEFLETKKQSYTNEGFECQNKLNDYLFPFQEFIVRRALKAGKYAIFADCGLGKTLMQLEWAYQVCKHTDSKVLILAPLAVKAQTLREAKKFNINMDNMSEYVDTITKYFPKELAFPLIDGIGTLISTITMKPTNNITIRLPCVEGVCRYPKLDDTTMMSTSHNNIFFAGDIVGHTRGLLQGFVMGCN
jgi:hypothetical protein